MPFEIRRKTPEEIELMKRMDALDEMSAAIDREEVKSKKKADKANKNAMAIGVSPEEQLMLDELNGSMDEEGAKEAADALASVEFDDSVFSSNDEKEEEQEEEMNNNDGEHVNEAAIGESEEDSSNGGGALKAPRKLVRRAGVECGPDELETTQVEESRHDGAFV